MHISLFDYSLPEELIAYYPPLKREESRMLVYKRNSDEIEHTYFRNILNYITQNDIIVLNNVKVIPARIFGKKEKTGGKVEILLVKKLKETIWEAFIKASKKPKSNIKIKISNDIFCYVKDQIEDRFIIEFNKNFDLEKYGRIPLPPYIKREVENIDLDRYQTVFADDRFEGAIAAPTAGLHFTKEILNKIKQMSIEIVYITLYVSFATFKPVRVENIEDHKMHYEDYFISEEAAEKINNAIKSNKNIIAVGTTVVRTLEANFKDFGIIKPGNFSTNLFIFPGFEFRVVNKLLTNFHLPKSTLLMLVSAFAGRDNILKCYDEAVKKRYRFFSYGDCMLII